MDLRPKEEKGRRLRAPVPTKFKDVKEEHSVRLKGYIIVAKVEPQLQSANCDIYTTLRFTTSRDTPPRGLALLLSLVLCPLHPMLSLPYCLI